MTSINSGATTIRPFHAPCRPDQRQVKWVEKNLSTFSEEPIAQAIPVSLTREQWVHDHYTWVIEEVKV